MLEEKTPLVVVVLFGAHGVVEAPCGRLVSLIIVCELPESRSTISALVGSDCWINPTVTYTTGARSNLMFCGMLSLTWLFCDCVLVVSRLSRGEVIWFLRVFTWLHTLDGDDDVAAKKPSRTAFDCQYW